MVIEGMTNEDRQKWRSDLYAPLAGTSPDTVSADVVADEMRSFMAFDREVN
jgi:hypothetical protein